MNERGPNYRKKIIDGNKTVEFYRQIHEVHTEDEMNLVLTRKTPLNRDPVGSVMLVHGLGQNRFSWTLTQRSFENYLVDLGYETFNVELRGHGLSRANGCDYPTSFGTYLTKDLPALIKAVYRLNGGKKFFYMGHSLGGSIGYCIGAEFQEYLAGMISLAGAFNMAQGNALLKAIAHIGVSVHKWAPIRPPIKPQVFYIDFIGVIGRYLLFILDNPKYKVPLQVWLPGSMERDILLERIIKGFDRTGFNVVRFFFEWGARGRFVSGSGKIDYEERIKDLTIPMLFIAGDRDYAVPLASMQEAYQKAGAEDKTIKEFGEEEPGLHWGHIDLITGKRAPDYVWPYISDWMQKKLPKADA